MKKGLKLSISLLMGLLLLNVAGCATNKDKKTNESSGTIDSTRSTNKEQTAKVKWPYYEIAKDGEVKGYLLGTVHIGKPEMFPFPEKIITDLESSTNFITELEVADMEKPVDPEEVPVGVMTETPITADMSEATRQTYQKILASYGLKEEDIAPYSRYGIYISLSQLAMISDTTYDPVVAVENGVDTQLTSFHKKNNGQKNIGLETLDFQKEIMVKTYNVPEDINAWVETLLPMEENQQSSSNVGAIQKYIDGKLDTSGTSKEQNDIINTSRNKTWSEILPQHLQQKNNSFIAVGAAHLLGEDSLIELLKKAGFDVSPVTFD